MLKRTVMVSAALLFAAHANAAHLWEDAGGWWGDHFVRERQPGPKFSAQEVSLDLFGSFNAGEDKFSDLFETNIRHGKWGGGVGLNYFITRVVGIGADMNMTDNGGLLVDQADASVIARLPIESAGLAPYIFGGGGRGFDPSWEWLGHAGLGLEARFNPTTGVFVDARYVWADHSFDRLMIRGGFRLVF